MSDYSARLSDSEVYLTVQVRNGLGDTGHTNHGANMAMSFTQTLTFSVSWTISAVDICTFFLLKPP